MCKDAIEWIELKGVSYQFRDIFREPLGRTELLELAEKVPNGIFDLYATKGARKVGLPEIARELFPEKIVIFQMENPDLIRYPIFDLGNELLFGFYESTKPVLLKNLSSIPPVE